MSFQRFFPSQWTEPVTITDERSQDFSLRFVSYIYFINSFWILVFFSSPLEEQFCVFKIFKMSAIFKMATKTRHKKWAVKIQHCPISTTFHIWVDFDVPNWFLTSKNFYRSPFSKWPPQYRTNSTLLQCFISKIAFDLFFKPVVSGQFGRLHNR